jgi:hypothetical protein
MPRSAPPPIRGRQPAAGLANYFEPLHNSAARLQHDSTARPGHWLDGPRAASPPPRRPHSRSPSKVFWITRWCRGPHLLADDRPAADVTRRDVAAERRAVGRVPPARGVAVDRCLHDGGPDASARAGERETTLPPAVSEIAAGRRSRRRLGRRRACGGMGGGDDASARRRRVPEPPPSSADGRRSVLRMVMSRFSSDRCSTIGSAASADRDCGIEAMSSSTRA